MFKDKHFELLGRAVKQVSKSQHSDLQVGKIVAQYFEMLMIEVERDARDEANGKGGKSEDIDSV